MTLIMHIIQEDHLILKFPDELKDFLANVSMDIDTKYINIRDNRVYYISRYMADERALDNKKWLLPW